MNDHQSKINRKLPQREAPDQEGQLSPSRTNISWTNSPENPEPNNSEPKISKNRRRRKDKKKGKISNRAAIILLIVVFILLAAFIFLRHKAFNVKYIRVEGNTVLSDEELIDQLNDSNRNIFLYSKNEIKKTLLQLPGIRSVQVRKELPNKLVITVEESYILAETDQEPPLLIDNEGKVLDKIPDGFSSRVKPLMVSFPDRKLEKGSSFSTDQRELDFLITLSHSLISDEVKKVVFNKSNNIDIILKDVKVYFGPLDDILEKISTLTAVYHEVQNKGVNAKEIILNQGKNPIVVTDQVPTDQKPSVENAEQGKSQEESLDSSQTEGAQRREEQ